MKIILPYRSTHVKLITFKGNSGMFVGIKLNSESDIALKWWGILTNSTILEMKQRQRANLLIMLC